MSRPLILGISGAAVVGAALGLTYFADDDAGKEVAAVLTAPETSQQAPAGAAAPPGNNSPAVPTKSLPRDGSVASSPVARPGKAVTAPAETTVSKSVSRDPAPVGKAAPASAAPMMPRKPTFDVVRVNPKGDAVIAGRAAPNAAVIVRDGQTEVGKARADARGEWVVIPSKPLPAGSRELTLSATTESSVVVQSDQNVVIMVPGKTSRTAAESGAAKSPGALAVLVPRDGGSGTIVIQKPSSARPAAPAARSSRAPASAPVAEDGNPKNVTIDSVDYDQSGNVTISGNSAPKAPLSVYIDNKHAGSGVSDREGRWRVVPGGALAPGDYTLRVDNLGAGGKVLGRAETQFTRAQVAAVAPSENVVSVEPGNSLWRIARRVYGRGIQYTVIFDANREQIRDPDLIYPGQVFFVPHVN